MSTATNTPKNTGPDPSQKTRYARLTRTCEARTPYLKGPYAQFFCRVKPGFHIVVSVVSVVRKQFLEQILYGNLPYKCSMQKKRQIHFVVRDRMNSICPMNFFRTTDTTDTTIWKPGLSGCLSSSFDKWCKRP